MGSQAGQMANFVRDLPHLAVFLHLLLDGINDLHDMLLKCFDIL
jgi:hypothetical protein